MYRDALSRAMLQKDQRVLGGARAAFPLPRGDATSRAPARRGILVSDDAWPRAIQTGLVLCGAAWKGSPVARRCARDVQQRDAADVSKSQRYAEPGNWRFRTTGRAGPACAAARDSSGSLRHWRAFGGRWQPGHPDIRKESAVALGHLQ